MEIAADEVDGREVIIMIPKRTMPILRLMEEGDFVLARFLLPVAVEVDAVKGITASRFVCEREELLRVMVRFRLPSLSVSTNWCMGAEGEDSGVESWVLLFLAFLTSWPGALSTFLTSSSSLLSFGSCWPR